MIKVEVVRKIQSYTLGIGGVGTLDWEVLLECGHIVQRTTEGLVSIKFQTEVLCSECEKMAIQNLEQFHVVHEKQTTKTRTY